MEEEESRALQRINETPVERAAKRRKLDEEVEDLKRHLEIVPDEDDDVYTEATPLARKVPVVDYEIIEINNKTYFKIIRADGTHQLYISFPTLLKNFDREDLEALWNLVKERFSTSKPKNFFDDFLLTTLEVMFEKPDAHAQSKELSTIKLVSRHQNTQQFGVMFPVELTNEDIRNSAAYKEYYDIASGAAPPKTKASVRKTKSSPDTIITPPTVAGTRLSNLAKGKQPAKSSKEKGTGIIPGVLDVPTDESDEEISWKSSDEDDDDEVDDRSNDDASLCLNVGGEEGHDAEDDDEELYRDVNINLEVKVAVQIQSDRLRDEAQAKNEEFFNNLDENIQKIINEQVKEQVKTSYDVAGDLSKMELKKILIKKMESNKCIHRSDE
nr:hypothetical protein [Tanacetum cinerariifolium]